MRKRILRENKKKHTLNITITIDAPLRFTTIVKMKIQ